MNLPTIPPMTLLFLIVAAAAVLSSASAMMGLAGETLAQNDIGTLLIVAERARDHIKTHIAPDSPDTVHDLFAQGALYVDHLEDAAAAGDVDSAERNFLYAMKSFKEISEQLHEDELHRAMIIHNNNTTTPPESQNATTTTAAATANATGPVGANPVSVLTRLAVYVDTLRTVSESINAHVDFAHLDALFADAWRFADRGEISAVRDMIPEIKEGIIKVDTILRLHGSEQMLQHAKEYAVIHLERVDAILAQADTLEIPADVVADLTDARNSLAKADTAQEILDAIRRVMDILER